MLDGSDEVPNAELSSLLRTLREVEQRIAELAGAQFDAALFEDGEPYLPPDARASLLARAATTGVVADIFDALPAHIALLDPTGHILTVNEAWRRFARRGGINDDPAMLGADYLAVSDSATGEAADYGRGAAAGIRAVLAGSTDRFELEYPCETPDGMRWFRLVATPVASGAGRGATVMHVDVTEARAAADALRRSEGMYRALFENNPEPTWVYDRETLRILAANQAAVDHYGYSREEFLAMSIADIRPAEDLPQLLESVAAATERDLAVGSGRHVRRDGSVIDVEISSSALDFEGRPAILKLAIDVTERREADAALRRSEELFRTMLLELPAYTLITDLDGRVSFINDALLASIGYTREEVLGRVGSDFYAKEEDREAITAALAHTFASGTIIPRWENELPTRDGGRRLVRWSSAFLHRDGEVVGLASIGEDVSDQRVLEEQLRQSQRLEAVGQLTGGVAHDFNNLLTVILGNGELLTDALADRPEERELAAMAVQAAERGAELTRSLLAFARRQPLAPQSVDVDRLLAGLDSLLRRTLGEQVELEISGTGPLWQALIDPSQLEGAVLNLALNARDAMPDGGQLTIEIANTTLDADYAALNPEADPGPYVLVAVSDTGTGIDPGILARVFDPFFTTKQPGTGTGLGLSMVHGFVKQSGGHVKIYSEPGHGTTVRMYLPRATDPAEETEHTPTILVGGTETVLLVEDDDQVRQYAQHVLTALGYHVISAENGPQALAIITDRDDIDLLFTDIVMPGGMTGRQLADAAVAARPGLRVLYTSGYTQNAIVHNGRLDPGVHLLSKPYKRADLARALRDALDGELDDVDPAQESNG